MWQRNGYTDAGDAMTELTHPDAEAAGRWAVTQIGKRIHVWPVADLRGHEDSEHCWCRPEQDEDEPSVWAHNALDQRGETLRQ